MLIVAVLVLLGAATAFFTKVERMPPVEINEMLIRTDWNNSIHVDENYNRVQDIIRQFKGRCTEISCHIGEKQFFLNPEDNGNINEAEFYIKTTDNESLKVLVGDITAYIKKNYPEARVEPAKVENLFEQLLREKMLL